MANTLTCKDIFQRTGYSVINGVRVVQYSCIIPMDNPNEMRIGITKLNTELYKKNRDICRADYAAFEDSAYELQAKIIAGIGDKT